MASPSLPTTARKTGLCTIPGNSNNVLLLVLISLMVAVVALNVITIAKTNTISLLATANNDDSPVTRRRMYNSNYNHPFDIPEGEAKNLPSIRIKDDDGNNNKKNKKDSNNKIVDRGQYGGKGDKIHLGGFTEIDIHGLSPMLWSHMVTHYGIKTIMDVGCGRGISTLWFYKNGLDTLCIEGAHDAIERTMLPVKSSAIGKIKNNGVINEIGIIEHDYSRGPYWPAKTYDAIWSVEVMEHIGRQFHKNVIPTFRKAAMIFFTHSRWDGWHHVEVHDESWFITKMEMYGFKYMPDLSTECRSIARREPFVGRKAPNGENANPQNLYTMLVFVNPVVASLPQHAHLMAEPGCIDKYYSIQNKTMRHCGTNGIHSKYDPSKRSETPIPPKFIPLRIKEENTISWENEVRKNVKSTPSTTTSKNTAKEKIKSSKMTSNTKKKKG